MSIGLDWIRTIGNFVEFKLDPDCKLLQNLGSGPVLDPGPIWPDQKTYEEAAGMGCENNYVPVNGPFYRHVDDVAMGSPIAPLMADVCMNYVIDQALAVTPPECQPDLLCRYVDDLFLLFSNQDSLNRFFANITSIHRNIIFTKELETNNCLHFLDVLIGNGNGLLFHMTQPISRSTIKAIACSKPTISEH